MGTALQNARVEGQQSVLKPTYAKQRASASGPVPDAVEVCPTLLASSNDYLTSSLSDGPALQKCSANSFLVRFKAKSLRARCGCAQAAQAMSAYSAWAPQQYQEDAEQPAGSAPADGAQAASSAAPASVDGQPPAENGTSGFTYDSNSGAKALCPSANFMSLA